MCNIIWHELKIAGEKRWKIVKHIFFGSEEVNNITDGLVVL